jgi:hypothetical protein
LLYDQTTKINLAIFSSRSFGLNKLDCKIFGFSNVINLVLEASLVEFYCLENMYICHHLGVHHMYTFCQILTVNLMEQIVRIQKEAFFK